ncbi:NIL domain-containing protein [Bacteroidota bacterium]
MIAAKEEKREKRRLVLTFPAERIEEPITYNLVKEYDIIVNILNADITHGKEGNLLIEMKGMKTNLDEALVYLESREVIYSPVVKNIILNSDLCIHCGACSSVCFSDALNMDKKDHTLVFQPENCIACELCIKACPLQLFELNFGMH